MCVKKNKADSLHPMFETDVLGMLPLGSSRTGSTYLVSSFLQGAQEVCALSHRRSFQWGVAWPRSSCQPCGDSGANGTRTGGIFAGNMSQKR
jgi:hypothetical protein